ncbi:MAG TPA: GIY-YIG nuclease family protein [Pyrinomonadaceae bacterium]|nr:GIY-YIG nuclease family protein [Pyrinomonadaceae bacterium]
MIDKKEAKRHYAASTRPMGVLALRNTVNGRVFVDSSKDLPGRINRHRFQLNAGNHPVKQLQADWKEFGEGAFEFEVLEDYEPPENKPESALDDLAALEALWLEKLASDGVAVYNERKLTREERLEMIAANRRVR